MNISIYKHTPTYKHTHKLACTTLSSLGFTNNINQAIHIWQWKYPGYDIRM